MSRYILVLNYTNRIATVHVETCKFLQSYPLNFTGRNGERLMFDDGMQALAKAETVMPRNFVICAHCLKPYRELLSRIKAEPSQHHQARPSGLHFILA